MVSMKPGALIGGASRYIDDCLAIDGACKATPVAHSVAAAVRVVFIFPLYEIRGYVLVVSAQPEMTNAGLEGVRTSKCPKSCQSFRFKAAVPMFQILGKYRDVNILALRDHARSYECHHVLTAD
jgi:hypothetical protein